MATKASTLFSWPAHPSLTTFHLAARAALLIANVVGLSVSFPAGAINSRASFWVAASFMSASLIFFQPLFIIWNTRQLRRSNISSLVPESIPLVQIVSTKFLEFAIIMDTIAVLGYWITWGFTIRDSTSIYSWRYNTGNVALMTYASAATLTCALLHSLLFGTQLLQLRSASKIRKAYLPVCPHCHHSLDVLPETSRRNGPGAVTAPPSARSQPEESQNLLGQEDYTDTDPDAQPVADMTPGQETGTCAVTPRVSTSGDLLRANDAGTANEDGTNENDHLIEKVACDLHAATRGKWLDRVIPHMV